MSIIRLVAIAVIVAGCEYHDRATSLSLEETCYVVTPSRPVTVRVQARDGADQGIDGVRVQWSVAPLALTLEPSLTTTAQGRIGGIAGDGIATTTLVLPEVLDDELPAIGTITVATAVADELLTASAELRLVADEDGATCTTPAVDAGVDTLVDAAVDASVGNPLR